MIPTTTYDQVRVEQEARLAHLEHRAHAHAAEDRRNEKAPTAPAHSGRPALVRPAIVTGTLLVTALGLFLLL
jgi:hypothetical protein